MGKARKKAAKKVKCDVGTLLACNGVAVRRVTGPKTGDPHFNCCLGCRAYLNRRGVRLKDV